MAEFRGVFNAPVLQVAPCGLLSVAHVEDYSANPTDERWVRGFSTLSNSFPTVRLLTSNNDPSDTVSDGSDAPLYYTAYPFFIEVEAKNTAKNLVSNDPFDYLGAQLTAATQKAVEYELWEGPAARDLPTPGTGYLIEEDGASIVTGGTGVTPERALAMLEQAISLSPTGARGTIHMTRDVASALGTRLLYNAKSRDDDQAYATTRLGTLVAIGSGYTGRGPINAAGETASETNKWMFATGAVEVILGAPEFVNNSLAQGFSTSTNDSTVLISRPAAVHFDPTIWFAAQVTLS